MSSNSRPPLLFGADRNITSRLRQTYKDRTVISTGQVERPKVLKWPNHELIVGYVGVAELEGIGADQWLDAFIGRHLTFRSLRQVAKALNDDLNQLNQKAPLSDPLILHLGGFEHEHGDWKPRIYFIRNATGLTDRGKYKVGNDFACSDEVIEKRYFGGLSGAKIRAKIDGGYFSFRQGYDLSAFNIIDQAVHGALLGLIQHHPGHVHSPPTTLEEWSKHIKFEINSYSAYFASFYRPFEQYVGGGANVVTAGLADPR